MSPFYVEGYLESPTSVCPGWSLWRGDGKAAVRGGACRETELAVEGVQIALNVGIVESINDCYCLAGAARVRGRAG